MGNRVIKLIYSLDRGFLPLAAVKGLIEAVIPYFTILLPAIIVNFLYEKTEPRKILMFIAGFYLTVLAVRILFQMLKKSVEDKKIQILNFYVAKKIRKVFWVKFSVLETAAFEKIQQGIRYNDENFSAFRNYMEEQEKVFRSFFQILIALGIFGWMAIGIAEAAVNRSIFSAIAGLLAGTFCIVVLLLRIQKAVNEKMPFLMDKIVEVNTLFFVLYEDVVQNYQKGKDVRLFGIDKLIVSEGEKMVENFAPYAKKQIFLSQTAGMVGTVLSLLIGGISVLVIGRFALDGYMAPGNVISFAGSIQQLSSAVLGIAFSFGNLNLWNVRMDAVFQILDIEEEQLESKRDGYQKLPDLETIEFQNVSFCYPEGSEDILKHISLTIRKGEKIAVVGPNGSGKSTFIKLLTGLYEPTEGRILLNGKDRADMDLETVRAYMAAVYQDFMIFSFTLEENITFGKKVEEKKMADVLKKMKLTEQVGQMEEGMGTWLYQDYGEEGREVSGGEAQKLAICRALYKDASYVVLDEPTAALDPVAEYEVYKDFQMLVEEKTAVFVSHRLSSCRFCQKIFVFEDGKVVQQGNHEELLEEKDGLYKVLWDTQAQYYVHSS